MRAKSPRTQAFDYVLRTVAHAPWIAPVPPPATAAVAAGDRPCGRFRVISPLGHGGMGSVHRVFDSQRGEQVALKRAHGGKSAGEPEPRLRLEREFRALAELRHHALVRVYELGQDEQGDYFTMEAIDGVDLLRYCRPERAFEAERLRRVLPALLEGLGHLHARGLVHRDLKPSNIIVDRNDQLRLIDFGILAELAAAGETAAGTAAYMAPEQIAGAPPSAAMDLYALGATLHEVVTGKPPFVGARLAVLAAHARERAPVIAPSAKVDPTLASVIHALLAKDPRDRPGLDTVAQIARGGLRPQ